jgi:hypothetical protein
MLPSQSTWTRSIPSWLPKAVLRSPVLPMRQLFPQLDLAAVHVDEQRPHLLGLKDGVAVPTTRGIVDGRSGGMDGGISHLKCSLSIDLLPTKP